MLNSDLVNYLPLLLKRIPLAANNSTIRQIFTGYRISGCRISDPAHPYLAYIRAFHSVTSVPLVANGLLDVQEYNIDYRATFPIDVLHDWVSIKSTTLSINQSISRYVNSCVWNEWSALEGVRRANNQNYHVKSLYAVK